MADILIRGVPMPVPDFHTTVIIMGNGDVFWYNEKVGTAVPLPEGHGRGIDADALLSVLDILRDKCGDSPVWDQMQNIVENLVTIVPAEGGGEDA